MARRLIADTGVLVASQRARAELAAVIAEEDDLVVAAITVAELRKGIELATDAHRGARSEFLVRCWRPSRSSRMSSTRLKRMGGYSPTCTAAGRNVGRTT